MIYLPDVTLIAITGKDFSRHVKVVSDVCNDITFGAGKVIYDKAIDTIDEWNRQVIYELPKYIQTSHALLIHLDGYPINPHLWNPEWLHYDYIGAPWPLPTDDYSYRSESGRLIRVGNSVSLRSKRLMER